MDVGSPWNDRWRSVQKRERHALQAPHSVQCSAQFPEVLVAGVAEDPGVEKSQVGSDLRTSLDWV